MSEVARQPILAFSGDEYRGYHGVRSGDCLSKHVLCLWQAPTLRSLKPNALQERLSFLFINTRCKWKKAIPEKLSRHKKYSSH